MTRRFVKQMKQIMINYQIIILLILILSSVCPAEPDILAIILGVIAGIVGVGLALLLIWKLLATLKVGGVLF